MTIPATIVADQAIAQQNFALSALKNAAQQDQAIAQILEDSARSAPANRVRGTHVNITA